MGDGLNIGQTWIVNVPDSTTRTVSPNLWQYSLFPNGTAPSVMYPCDGLTNLNDAQLMNFDYGVTSFADTSANMYQIVMPMLKQWMAQQAEMYQKIMSSLHSNTNINVNNNNNNNNDSNIDGTKVIKESQIKDVLNRIANDPNNKDRFNKEITITNKDGKEEKTTLLRRLIDLSKQYQDDPTTAEISEENYKLLWDIAGKYAKTGELSTEDYGKLLEIAKNPGGPGAYKEDDEDGENTDTETPVQRSANYLNGYMSKEANHSTGQLFFDAMNGAGTNKGKMKQACEATNKYNVMEVLGEYNQINAYVNGEDWIDAVFDDCDNWGSGEGGKWYCFGMDDDDAKPFVDKLSYAMIERAADVQELSNCSEENKKALADKAKALENALKAADASNPGHSNKDLSEALQNSIKAAFKDLYNAIKAAEIQVYGKEK